MGTAERLDVIAIVLAGLAFAAAASSAWYTRRQARSSEKAVAEATKQTALAQESLTAERERAVEVARAAMFDIRWDKSAHTIDEHSWLILTNRSTTDVHDMTATFDPVLGDTIDFASHVGGYSWSRTWRIGALPGGHDTRTLVRWRRPQRSEGGVLNLAVSTSAESWRQRVRVDQPPHMRPPGTAQFI